MYKVMSLLEVAIREHLEGILESLALQLVHSLLPLVLLSLGVLVVIGLKVDSVLLDDYFDVMEFL